jgi:hypothetical protein
LRKLKGPVGKLKGPVRKLKGPVPKLKGPVPKPTALSLDASRVKAPRSR